MNKKSSQNQLVLTVTENRSTIKLGEKKVRNIKRRCDTLPIERGGG